MCLFGFCNIGHYNSVAYDLSFSQIILNCSRIIFMLQISVHYLSKIAEVKLDRAYFSFSHKMNCLTLDMSFEAAAVVPGLSR